MKNAFRLLLVMTIFTSCSIMDQSPDGTAALMFKTKVCSDPPKWVAGDSIQISIEVISDDKNFTAEAPEIYLPFSNMANFDFQGPIVNLSWLPDSLASIPPTDRYLRLYSTFISKTDTTFLRVREQYNIVIDSVGYYFFQRDQNSYKIDTFPVN
jgi:hypothetical protein